MAALTPRRHLFFDLDDTLWDFEHNSRTVLQELFAEFELEQKLQADFQNFYLTYRRVNQELWQQYYQRQIDKAYLRNHRFNLAFKEFEYDNYNENLQVTAQYLARAPLGKTLKEGCLETLSELKQRHTLHLITNGFCEAQYIKLDNCGLRPYFSTLLVSEEHGLTKPDPRIFRLAETMTGARPDECVMIGDNLECDIHGARNAGWDTVYFSEQASPAAPGQVIRRLPELKALF